MLPKIRILSEKASNKSSSELNFVHFRYSFKDGGTSSLMSFAPNDTIITMCILNTQPRSLKLYWKCEI